MSSHPRHATSSDLYTTSKYQCTLQTTLDNTLSTSSERFVFIGYDSHQSGRIDAVLTKGDSVSHCVFDSDGLSPDLSLNDVFISKLWVLAKSVWKKKKPPCFENL
jgi:hypothetical protein